MADAHTRLNKISNLGSTTLTSLIQDNIVEFFDWGLIEAGGFFNVYLQADSTEETSIN